MRPDAAAQFSQSLPNRTSPGRQSRGRLWPAAPAHLSHTFCPILKLRPLRIGAARQSRRIFENADLSGNRRPLKTICFSSRIAFPIELPLGDKAMGAFGPQSRRTCPAPAARSRAAPPAHRRCARQSRRIFENVDLSGNRRPLKNTFPFHPEKPSRSNFSSKRGLALPAHLSHTFCPILKLRPLRSGAARQSRRIFENAAGV